MKNSNQALQSCFDEEPLWEIKAVSATTSFSWFASFPSKLMFEVRCLQNEIDCNCTVVRTAQLECAAIKSKPLRHEHGSEKPGKTLEFGIGWLDRCDSSINPIRSLNNSEK